MAEKKNPFELEGRKGGPERPYAARTWTPEEQTEKLADYVEVPPELWSTIRHGTHMRYYTKEGEYRVGGFVMRNPFDTKVRDEPNEKRFFKLQSSLGNNKAGTKDWLAAYESTSRVFIKPDATALIMLRNLETATRGLNDNIRKLAEHSKKLEQRLAALERR